MKILVIRFSSIGDIIMTTPVVRCVKKQLAAEIHYVTKSNFLGLLNDNPHIDKLIGYDGNWKVLMAKLQAENYDLVIDLHNNFRSRRLCAGLRQKSVKINKLSFQKQVLIYTGINHLPNSHVSHRGLEIVADLGVIDDHEGMDFFFSDTEKFMKPFMGKEFVALALGTTHFTKNMPWDLLKFVVENCPHPMVFLGGIKEKEIGEALARVDPTRLYNMAGNCSLVESAKYVDLAKYLVSGDTGMLHIAAALKKPTISIWGATIPGYGVFPFYGKYDIPHYIHEVTLSCRPCSKHGSSSCPKKHFNCMQLQDRVSIREHLQLLG